MNASLYLTRLEKMMVRLIQSAETISKGMSAMRSAFLQSQVAPLSLYNPPNFSYPIFAFINQHQSPSNNSKNPYASHNTHIRWIMMQKLRPEMHIILLWLLTPVFLFRNTLLHEPRKGRSTWSFLDSRWVCFFPSSQLSPFQPISNVAHSSPQTLPAFQAIQSPSFHFSSPPTGKLSR